LASCPDCSGYLTGSYAGGYQSPSVSDIDISIVTRGDESELKAVLDSVTYQTLASASQHSLDIMPVTVNRLKHADDNDILGREAIWAAKLSGMLIWGPDVLAKQNFSDASYNRETGRAYLEFIRRCGWPDDPVLELNLDRLIARMLADDSTKILVSLATWTSTVILASEYGLKVGSKKQAIEFLLPLEPELASRTQKLFLFCRDQNLYRFPKSQQGISDLKGLVEGCTPGVLRAYQMAKIMGNLDG